MKLGTWRTLVVLAVALSAGVGIYEFVSPRIDFVDGDDAAVGRWLTIPGRPTATYVVLSVARGSNLTAAGIAVGDRYIPHDSFAARWLWRPGERIPVTVIAAGTTRDATIVASHRPLPGSRLGWLVRIGRIVLQIAMLALAIVVAWHFADAPWVRWLCGFLVLSGFSPWQVDPLEYIGWWRIAAFQGEAIATQAAICAAMIFAVTIRGRPTKDFRMWMVRLAGPTFVFLTLCIVGLLFDARGAYVAPPLRLVQLGCIVATVAALMAAAGDATGQERQRLRYMAWTFAVGFSGFFFSFAALWIVGNNWGTNFQAWSIPRSTLLVIPIGLAYGLLSHRVVSSHYIASRTLLYGALTSSLVPIFAGTEWAATNFFGTGRNAFIAAVAVIITASFKKVQRIVDDFISRVLFKKQHAVEQALGKFSKEVAHIDDAAALVQRYVSVVDEHVEPASTALYVRAHAEKRDDGSAFTGYLRVASAGSPSPERIEPLDPVVVSLKAECDVIESGMLGAGGHAFPMIARNELRGLLAIGPLRDGEILTPEGMGRLTQLTDAVGVALEGLRLTDLETRLAEAETERAELQRILTAAARPPG